MENYGEQIQFQIIDNNKYIYKSNNLIESSYNLSINEQRLIYMGVKKLKPIYVKSKLKPSQLKTFAATQEFGDLRIYVNEFKKEFDLNGNSLYERLAEVAHTLFNNKIQYLEEDGTFVEKRWVITCKYNEKGKYISLTFHPELILDLLIFKSRYGEIQYDVSKSFKNTYSFRIYELLKNYSYKKSRKIELNDFRHKLGIYDDSKYSSFAELKRNVIDPSIKAINETSDITVEFEPVRYGRKVGALNFNIEINNKENLLIDDDDILDKSHLQNVCEIVGKELTSGQVNMITNEIIKVIREEKIDMTVYEYLESKIKIIKEYSKNKEIDNYIGMVIKSIKENWVENIELEKGVNPKGFNNFEGRQYTDDEYQSIEEQLLGWRE